MRKHVLLSLAVLLGGCAANPAPVPVVGTKYDITSLAGEWSGEYRSPETGRSGIITFALVAGRDTASGDVIMTPQEDRTAMMRGVHVPYPRESRQILAIRFIRVEGEQISGVIEPYMSPDCDCLLNTVFRGTLRGDRIKGDYMSSMSGSNELPQRGTWWATRVKRATTP